MNVWGYKSLVLKPLGNNPFGTLKHRGEYNTYMDLGENS
jgi:hypothetical protein